MIPKVFLFINLIKLYVYYLLFNISSNFYFKKKYK